MSYDTVIIRGVSHEKFEAEDSRYSILKDDIEFTGNTLLTGRIMIYK